jgi:selenocysteine-specific elongation factor
VKFHSGTNEVVGRIIFMDKEKLLPGDTALVQFRLEKPVAPLPWDRYIVRSLSPITTIGGGVILEVNPPKYRSFNPEVINFLNLLEKGAYHEVLEYVVKKRRYHALELKEMGWKVGLKREEIDSIVQELVKEKRLISIEKRFFIHREWYENLKKETEKQLRLFHKENPIQVSIPKEELRTRVSSHLNAEAFNLVFRELSREKIIELKDGGVRLAHQSVRLSSRQKQIIDRLEKLCQDSWFRPLGKEKIKEVFNGQSKVEMNAILKLMVAENRLIRLKDGRLIHTEAMEQIKEKIKEHIQNRGKITLSECKNLLGIGRVVTLTILEYLDSIKFTLRVGDHRVLVRGE